MQTEIASGAPAFYRDKEGKVHFVSNEIGEAKVRSREWIEISKEEAIAMRKAGYRETVGMPSPRDF